MMSIEYFEIMGDLFEEPQEWNDFEADMATDPYDDAWPPAEVQF